MTSRAGRPITGKQKRLCNYRIEKDCVKSCDRCASYNENTETSMARVLCAKNGFSPSGVNGTCDFWEISKYFKNQGIKGLKNG